MVAVLIVFLKKAFFIYKIALINQEFCLSTTTEQKSNRSNRLSIREFAFFEKEVMGQKTVLQSLLKGFNQNKS